MARISTYGVDAKPELQDKVLGTDTAAGANLRTKNYSLSEIVDLFNESNSLAIADQSVFKFQSDISKGRDTGTISFTGGGGVGTTFVAATTVLLSKTANGGGSIANFLALFPGKDIILAEVNNINHFGRYTVGTMIDYVADTSFLEVQLTNTASNGAFALDAHYIFSEFQNPDSDAGDLNFTFDQPNGNLAVWVIEHNLGKNPSITVIDSAGTLVIGEWVYDTLNKLTITFTAGFSGKAFLN